MGALSFDALLRSLKHGPPGPAYYLHGDEDLLKDEAIRALVASAVEGSAQAFNLDQRRAAELDPAALHALVNTPPLGAPRRAVVLRGIELVKKQSALYRELERYLGAPNPTTLLVLVGGAGEPPDPAIAARACDVTVAALEPARVLRWAAHYAGLLGLTFEAEALPFLLDAVGRDDLRSLAQELDKLAAATAGRPATVADVTALVGVRHGETVGDLVAAALERRTLAAVALLGPVLEQAGMTGVRIAGALGTALVGTGLARAQLDAGVSPARLPAVLFQHLRTARPFGVGDWRTEAERWAAWARLWSALALGAALRGTLAADRALKSSSVRDERAILSELFLTWPASAARARDAA